MPNLTKKYYLNFYGGEPLLSFNLIKKTLFFLNRKNQELGKKAKFSITTNGSLITEEISQFLNEHKFSVELSFDGLAQDVSRKDGSFHKIILAIQQLLNCPNIDLEINSVFTPQTVEYLSNSIQFIINLGVSDIHFSLSTIEPWDKPHLQKLEYEMSKLNHIVLSHYKKRGDIPVTNLRKGTKKGIFFCSAGKDRLAITPDGQIWGCFLFPDYFLGKEDSPEYKKYCFGSFDRFLRESDEIYPSISSNYASLSMDNFSTSKIECLFCPELEKCAVCPINAAFSGSPIGEIPSYICEIQKIKIKQRQNFNKEFRKILPQ